MLLPCPGTQTHNCAAAYKNIPYGMTDLEVGDAVHKDGVSPVVAFCFSFTDFLGCTSGPCCNMTISKVC